MCIYGTEDRPRHPFWRNALRTVAFGGAPIALLVIFGVLAPLLLAFSIMWTCSLLIVLMAEYEIGKPIYRLFAGITGGVVIAAGIWPGL